MVRKRKGSRVDRLIEEDVRKAKPKSKAYTLVDGRGLGITILPSGSKSWRLRFRWMSKHAVHVLGPFPELSLADARERAIAARRLILDGVHPTHHRGRQRELRRQEDERQQTEKAAQAYTVGDCLTDWHTGRKWTRKEYADQIRSFLDSFFTTTDPTAPLTPAGTWKITASDADGNVAHEFTSARTEQDDVMGVSTYWSDVPPGLRHVT